MREVRIKASANDWEVIAKVARAAGVGHLSLYREIDLETGEERAVISAELSTPRAREFVHAILDAPFYAPDRFAITSREVRAIVTDEPVAALTVPIVAPTPEIRQELWQFSHLTGGLVVRAFAAALLLAYGVLEAKLLVMAAGLLFLPATALFLAIAFGLESREPSLVKQASLTLVVITGLLVAGGLVVGLATRGAIRGGELTPLATGAFLSFAIGVAGAIATGDDVGRRELIGLAAASQFAIVPAWLGLAIARGDLASAAPRLSGFGVNIVILTLTAALTYAVLRARRNARAKAGRTSRERAAIAPPKLGHEDA